MLFPFQGLLLGGSQAAASGAVASHARRLRDSARRYQPALVVDRAVRSGALRASRTPHLYRYRITDEAHGLAITGVVGEVPAAGIIPHERTRASLVVEAPLIEIRPILLVTRDPLPRMRVFGDVAAAVEGTRRHEVAAVRGQTPAFGDGVLVIADGHHRTRAVLESRGPHTRIMALVVGDSGKGLTVGTFHRRFRGAGALPDTVRRVFTVEQTTRRTAAAGSILWVEGSGRRYLLTASPRALDSVPSALHRSVAAVASGALYPLLGVSDDDAEYLATAESAVGGLEPDDVALIMPPAPMDTVLAAAEAGTPFPPKATRFSPKPVRGLVVRVAGD